MPSKLMTPKTDDDWLRWGLLIKSWAMDVNLLEPGKPVPSRPTNDIKAFKKALSDNKIDMDIDGAVTGFEIFQQPENTIVVKLPPKKLLTDSHNELDGSRRYGIPNFYITAFGASAFTIHGTETNKEFHAYRIGDYTLSTCA